MNISIIRHAITATTKLCNFIIEKKIGLTLRKCESITVFPCPFP